MLCMRGEEDFQEELFSYGSLSQRVPLDHPLRRVRLLAEQMGYNLLFRWFVGLGMNDRVWD
jgi:hypothetical protein